jgi:hypothetical protein
MSAATTRTANAAKIPALATVRAPVTTSPRPCLAIIEPVNDAGRSSVEIEVEQS